MNKTKQLFYLNVIFIVEIMHDITTLTTKLMSQILSGFQYKYKWLTCHN